MKKILTLGVALASLTAFAGAAGAAITPRTSPVTHIRAYGPPEFDCQHWDNQAKVCHDANWRGRDRSAWAGHDSCRANPQQQWYIDSHGMWRHC
jgi:hypothetical protein